MYKIGELVKFLYSDSIGKGRIIKINKRLFNTYYYIQINNYKYLIINENNIVCKMLEEGGI